jgi:hypothetical protein
LFEIQQNFAPRRLAFRVAVADGQQLLPPRFAGSGALKRTCKSSKKPILDVKRKDELIDWPDFDLTKDIGQRKLSISDRTFVGYR